MKPCPHCGKEIQDEAIKCRWCLTFVDVTTIQTISSRQTSLDVFRALFSRFRYFRHLRLVIAVAVATICSATLYGVLVGNCDAVINPLVWKFKAAIGNADAQYQLGRMYYSGDNGTMNYAKAIEWYQKAAGQGSVDAQHDLGKMFASGNGVPRDSARAAEWYRKAADQGSADAQVKLGHMYASGDGVSSDSEKAAEWFQKSAEQGNADAQYNLGKLFASGDGVPRDSARATEWYRKAAEQGNADAKAAFDVISTVGDKVLCQVNTLYFDALNDYHNTFYEFNSHIQNLHAFIKRNNGTLTLKFDYNLKNGPPPIMQFLVRMFDKNGQHINHFVTKEYFYTQGSYASLGRSTGGRMVTVRLKSEGNILQYSVNMRDASYVDAVEFGISPR